MLKAMLGLILVVLVVAQAASAQTLPALPQPAATQPAVSAAGAFQMFLVDLQQGSVPLVRDACVAKGDKAKALLADFQAVASAIGYLRQAASSKLGADAADAVLPQMLTTGDLEDVTEHDSGDHATLSGGNLEPLQMVRDRGRWKLDLDWMAASPELAGNSRVFGQLALEIRRTADDITAGRLKTAADAAVAMQAREQALPDSDASAATAPTTRP